MKIKGYCKDCACSVDFCNLTKLGFDDTYIFCRLSYSSFKAKHKNGYCDRFISKTETTREEDKPILKKFKEKKIITLNELPMK